MRGPCASLLLAQKIPMKVVPDLLGHNILPSCGHTFAMTSAGAQRLVPTTARFSAANVALKLLEEFARLL